MDGDALQFASGELRGDKRLVIKAAENKATALKHADSQVTLRWKGPRGAAGGGR